MSANWKKASACRTCRACSGRPTTRFNRVISTRPKGCAPGFCEYRPEDFEALHLLGVLNFQRRRLVEALRFLSQALQDQFRLRGRDVQSWARASCDRSASRRRSHSIAAPCCLRRIIRKSSTISAMPVSSSAASMRRLRTYDEVLAKNPGHVGALVNRGNTLLRFNRPAEAMSSYDKALAAMPGHPQILTNRGHALRRLDRPAEALVDFEAALAAGPEFPEAHFESAMTRLTLGDFDAGWKAYEWRWKTGAFARQAPAVSARRYGSGDAPVSGKTILLHAEQGFGDTIQFIRYAPLLAGMRRQGCLRSSAGIAAVVVAARRTSTSSPRASRFPRSICIVRCSVFRSPSATKPETIPAAHSISRGPGGAPGRIGAIVCRRAGPRAGFVWSGSPSHKNDANRSIPLARLAALFRGSAATLFQPPERTARRR